MVVIRRPRLTKLATLIDEARNTLSSYLTLSTFGSPITETPPLDYKREGHPPRKNNLDGSRSYHIIHSQACNSPNSHKHLASSNTTD
jgi:hypothetical protein